MTAGHAREATERARRPPYGLRGWLLLLVGLTWTVLGLSFVGAPSSLAGADTYSYVQRYLPLPAWGWVWVGTGAVGALAGVIRRHGAGFVVLSLMPGGWGVGLTAATLFDDAPRGYVLGVLFLLLAAIVAITSRMEDARLLLRRKAS